MPTYVYECVDCGEITEVLQKITEDPLTTCEKCSGSLRRVITPNPFILRGDGWESNKSKSKYHQ